MQLPIPLHLKLAKSFLKMIRILSVFLAVILSADFAYSQFTSQQLFCVPLRFSDYSHEQPDGGTGSRRVIMPPPELRSARVRKEYVKSANKRDSFVVLQGDELDFNKFMVPSYFPKSFPDINIVSRFSIECIFAHGTIHVDSSKEIRDGFERISLDYQIMHYVPYPEVILFGIYSDFLGKITKIAGATQIYDFCLKQSIRRLTLERRDYSYTMEEGIMLNSKAASIDSVPMLYFDGSVRENLLHNGYVYKRLRVFDSSIGRSDVNTLIYDLCDLDRYSITKDSLTDKYQLTALGEMSPAYKLLYSTDPEVEFCRTASLKAIDAIEKKFFPKADAYQYPIDLFLNLLNSTQYVVH